MKEAVLYKKLKDKKVRCNLCNHRCLISPGKRGICFVRENKDGRLYSLVYGIALAANIDPIEKKPLYHFQPGTESFSIATAGCNFRCKFCFTPNTQVATRDGVYSLEELFNFNKKPSVYSHTGKLKKIKKVFKHQYEGEIMRIKPYYTPQIECTPSHEFFATTDPEDKRIQKIKAKDLTTVHYLLIPKNYPFSNQVAFDLKQVLLSSIGEYKKSRKTSFEDVLKIIQLSQDGVSSKTIGRLFSLHPAYVRTMRSRLKNKKISQREIIFEKNLPVEKNGKIKFKTEKRPSLPRFVKLNKNFAKLLGYYCAEGWVGKVRSRPSSYCLAFSFSKKEKKYAEEVKELISAIFGLKARIVTRRTTIAVEIGKSSLALLFKNLCGSGASEKRVPEAINQAPKVIIQQFLEGYINGDGWRSHKEIAINTTSHKLALGVYWLVLKLGFLPRFYIWQPPENKKIEGRTVKQSTLYYVKWKTKKPSTSREKAATKYKENSHYYLIPINKISKKRYRGWVFNLEVEKDHSYLANFISVGNCQNWQISQITKGPKGEIIGEKLSPNEIVKKAKETNCASIAYTYTEPTIFFEYAQDTAKLAKKEGITNVFVTNGYQTPETIKEMAKFVDAANIDLKSFSEKFYQKVCGAKLKPVLESIKLMHQAGIWIEITTLVVPKQNDSKKELTQIAKFIAKVDKSIPWHISRFHPDYKMLDSFPTPIETLEMAYGIGKKAGLKYVYLGNIITETKENTCCPKCNNLAIRRVGYQTEILGVDKKGKCSECGENLSIRFS